MGENQSNDQQCPHYSDLTELYSYYGFLLDLNLAAEAPQSEGKSRPPGRDGKKRASPVSKEANGMDDGQKRLEAKSLVGDKMVILYSESVSRSNMYLFSLSLSLCSV